MAQTVIGIFDNASEAQQALQQLLSNGFSENNIDISTANSGTGNTSGSMGSSSGSSHSHNDDDSFSGFFRSLFDSNDDADRYTTVGRSGSIITVHAQSSQEAERAAEILDDNGAVDVDERAQQYQSSGTTGTTGNLNTSDFSDQNANQSIKVIEEELQVGKRVVETGGARLRSRIIEKPVEESLRLRHERIRIERNPVNRPATEADLANFQEGTIELHERAEVPVVNKEARVVEEISLGKEVEEHEETIRDTVRRTDVEVDDLSTNQDRTRLSDDDYNRTNNL